MAGRKPRVLLLAFGLAVGCHSTLWHEQPRAKTSSTVGEGGAAEGGAAAENASQGGAAPGAASQAGAGGETGAVGGSPGTEGGDGGGGWDPTGVAGLPANEDREPPYVVATEPPDGATGVTSSRLVVRFSEPMAAHTVRVSLTAAEIERSSWNEGGDVLTLETGMKLPTLDSPPSTSERPSYRLEVDGASADRAGNALMRPVAVSFQTGVRVAQSIPINVALRGHSEGTWILAGDTSANGSHLGLLTFVLVDLSEHATFIERATLRLAVRKMTHSLVVLGDPLRDLGDAVLEHAVYQERNAEAYAPTAKLGDVGVLFRKENLVSPDVVFDIDVTREVNDDWAQRASRQSRSQYRVRLQRATDGDSMPDQLMLWNQPPVQDDQCGGPCPDYKVPRLNLTYTLP